MANNVLLNVIKTGGPITWVIVGLGIVSMMIVIERFFHLRRAQIDVQDFLPGVINTLRSQSVREAIMICDETPGPAAHIVRQAILHRDGGEKDMYRATKEACLSELPRLERSMKALLTIVHLSPLLGLLGTVGGFIGMFSRMEKGTTSFMSVSQMAPDIKVALISTAAGLSVAIVGYMFYNLFRQQIDNILIDMEKSATEIIYFLQQEPNDVNRTQTIPAIRKPQTGVTEVEKASEVEAEDDSDEDNQNFKIV